MDTRSTRDAERLDRLSGRRSRRRPAHRRARRDSGIGPRARFRPGHDVALGPRLRLCAAVRPDDQNQDQRAGAEGSRHQDQSRRRRRADDPGARHLGRLSPAPAPTSSARSTTGRSSTPTASSMSAMSARRSARRRAAFTKPRRRSPLTARNGSPSRTRSSACRSPTAPRGGTRSATGRRNIRRPGRNGARPARS